MTAAEPRARAATLAAIRERFAAAARAAGEHTVDLAVGGRAVRLRFAGSGLPPRIVPALAHLREPAAGPPALTVYLWDTASTGVPNIPPPWPLDELGPGGAIPGAAAEGLRASFQWSNGLLQLVDPAAGVGVLWISAAADLARHETAAPLRPIFADFFEHLGMCVTHGGAVGRAGRGGVLIGGPGGAGKSTTALRALLAGLDYAGDDYVLVDAGARWVHSLYSTAKVAPAGLPRVAGLARAFAEPPPAGEKAIAFLAEHCPERLGRGFPLRALLLPRVGAETRLEPLTRVAALRGLAVSTVFQYNGRPAATLGSLRRLVDAVPAYRLTLGPDPVPALLALLETL